MRGMGARGGEFELFESILWEPGAGYFLLALHLDRLLASARHFGFPVTEGAVREVLDALAPTLGAVPRKVRLYAARDGRLRTGAKSLDEDFIPDPLHVGLAQHPVRSDDPFILHKTTERGAYERAKATRPDCQDVLLWNERGEITETTRANVVVRRGDRWVTPPVASGLLAGTFRAHLLARGELVEAVVHADELPGVGPLKLISSIRRWYDTVWVPASRQPR
jgi:para-aminobenzoate synthetase/4-amino-4-deoxychorismate lyase